MTKHSYVNILCSNKREFDIIVSVLGEYGIHWVGEDLYGKTEYRPDFTHLGINTHTRELLYGTAHTEKILMKAGEHFFSFKEFIQSPTTVLSVLELVR